MLHHLSYITPWEISLDLKEGWMKAEMEKQPYQFVMWGRGHPRHNKEISSIFIPTQKISQKKSNWSQFMQKHREQQLEPPSFCWYVQFQETYFPTSPKFGDFRSLVGRQQSLRAVDTLQEGKKMLFFRCHSESQQLVDISNVQSCYSWWVGVLVAPLISSCFPSCFWLFPRNGHDNSSNLDLALFTNPRSVRLTS